MMKKSIIGILIVVGAIGGYFAYTMLNNPLDTLNYATWDMVPEESKTFFARIGGGDMEKGEDFYRTYFMKFNPIHEVGHGLRDKYGVKTSKFEEEQSVNDIAVAYWRDIGEDDLIDELEIAIKEALSHMENPTPQGEDPAEYFNTQYHTLGSNPENYGYYQFSFVLNSIKKTQSFYEVLGEKVSSDVKEKNGETKIVHHSNDVIAPEDVVGNFVEYLKLYNIQSPDIKFNKTFRQSIQSID